MIIQISIFLIIIIFSVIGFIYYQNYKRKEKLNNLDRELINLINSSNFISESSGVYKLKDELEIKSLVEKINLNNDKWLQNFDQRTYSNSETYSASICRDNRVSQINYFIQDLQNLINNLKLSKSNSHLEYFLKKFNYHKVFFPPNVIDFNKIDSAFKSPNIIQLDQELMEFAKLSNFVIQDEKGTNLREIEDILKLEDVVHLNINKWDTEIENILNQNDNYLYDQSGYRPERKTYGEIFLMSIEQVIRDEKNPDISSSQDYLKRFAGDFHTKYDFKNCNIKCKGLY